jgi:oligosaccharide repeat unit polymerase
VKDAALLTRTAPAGGRGRAAVRRPEWFWWAVAVGVVSIAGAAFTTEFLPGIDRKKAAIVAMVVLPLLLLLLSPRILRRDWFHPLVLPVFYTYLVLMAPVVYLVTLDRDISNLVTAELASLALIVVFVLTIVGLVVGVHIGLLAGPDVRRPRTIAWNRLRLVGLVALGAASAVRAYTVMTSVGYGLDQVTYRLTDSLDILGQLLLLVGTVICAVACVQLFRRVFALPEVLLVGAYIVFSLKFGSRGELVAPIIFLAWAQHEMVRKIRLWRLLLIAAIVAYVFQGVTNTRQGLPFSANVGDAAVNVLVGVSSPVHVTGVVVALTPSQFPFTDGSTYLAALKRQLPGPIAVELFGPAEDTASFLFRRMVNLRSVDAGYSFSLPSEGYLNFGYLGAFLAGAVLGGLLGWAYRKSRVSPTRALHVFYPILLAEIPHLIRTDALGSIKSVLYPMLMIWVAFGIARVIHLPVAVSDVPREPGQGVTDPSPAG